MRRIVLAVLVALLLATATPAGAYTISRHNCRLDNGVFGFFQDWLVNNSRDAVQVALSYVPRPTTSDVAQPTIDGKLNFDTVWWVASVLKIGVRHDTVGPRETLNAVTRFLCFTIEPDFDPPAVVNDAG